MPVSYEQPKVITFENITATGPISINMTSDMNNLHHLIKFHSIDLWVLFLVLLLNPPIPPHTTRSDWLQQKRFSLDLDNFMCKWEIDIHSKLSYIDHSSSDRMSVDLPKSLPLRNSIKHMCFYLLSFFISFIQDEKKHIGVICDNMLHTIISLLIKCLTDLADAKLDGSHYIFRMCQRKGVVSLVDDYAMIEKCMVFASLKIDF